MNSQNNGQWVPLVEYANRKGVSLSTLRRYIKAQQIRFKQDDGKYFIWDEAPPDSEESIQKKVHTLERDVEEIKMSLQTLMALYEEKFIDKP